VRDRVFFLTVDASKKHYSYVLINPFADSVFAAFGHDQDASTVRGNTEAVEYHVVTLGWEGVHG
jgi:hypothetical protein